MTTDQPIDDGLPGIEDLAKIDFASIPFGDMGFALPSPEESARMARERFDRVSPFMIDRWPESVRALSFPTKMVEVTAEEMEALFDYHAPGWKDNATKLADRLDAAMDWDDHFIRMASRSPKDVSDKLITCSGRQAVAWISHSERCMDDVFTATRAGERMYICLREPRHLWKDAEFRCFARGGEMIAVSRYFYGEEPEHRPEAGTMFAAAKAFYETHLKAHFEDVVFDLHAPGTEHEILIEINPYGLSDPCLFGSYDEVEKGGERL